MKALNRFSFPAGARHVAVAMAASLTVLSACETPPAATPSGTAAQPRVTAAYFETSPALMFKAAQLACSEPNETFHTPRRDVAQCRILLDPETTAASILAFDGTVKALPKLVIGLASTKADKGYVVTGCTYLMVPMKNGRVRRVVQNDRAIDAKLREMMRAGGGKPVASAPPGAADACLSV